MYIQENKAPKINDVITSVKLNIDVILPEIVRIV